jgi:hypothetical protein
VLAAGGAAALQAHAPAPLQWERLRLLAGPGAVGLPIGYEPPRAAAAVGGAAAAAAALPAPPPPARAAGPPGGGALPVGA